MVTCIVLHGLTPTTRETIRAGVSRLGKIKGFDTTFLNVLGPIEDHYRDGNVEIVVVTPEALALRSTQIWPYIERKILSLCNSAQNVVLLPQDEYSNSRRLEKLAAKITSNVKIVGPFANYSDTILPRLGRVIEFAPCLPGYLSNEDIVHIRKFCLPVHDRRHHAGTRVAELGIEFGEIGSRKSIFANEISRLLGASGLSCDISSKPEDVIRGDDWFRFMANCRWTPIAKGGSSIVDRFGFMANRSRAFTYLNYGPEVKKKIAKETRGGPFVVESPRLFEAVALEVGLIMPIEEYVGDLQPDIDYLPAPKASDQSSVEEFISKIKDDDYLSTLTKSAYKKIIGNGIADPNNFLQIVFGNLGVNNVAIDEDAEIVNDDAQYALAQLHLIEGSNWTSAVDELLRLSRRALGKSIDRGTETSNTIDAGVESDLLFNWKKMISNAKFEPESLTYPWTTV